MGLSSIANGSQTATISTVHALATSVVAGIYVLVVETTNMTAGDTVIIKINTKVKSAETSRLAYTLTYTGAQTDLNKYSVPVPVDTEISCTLQQTAGTGRAFPWNLLRA
ncbi:MAG: hypothetical protein J0652_02575 [Desulfobulbaceae bacterium]|nr:hypothetical protein [Desulfobulbaceae bacterium]